MSTLVTLNKCSARGAIQVYSYNVMILCTNARIWTSL